MLGYGALQCWASNSIGMQKTPCIIRIIPAGPPESLRDCVVTNQTFDSVKVECQAGYDGGLKQQFHLDVYNSAIKHLQANLTVTDVPIFTVQDLPRGTTFVLLLYAKNAKGQSQFVTLTATTLSPAARRSASSEASGVTPILGVLIGVVGALVIIAVVVIVVMKLQSNDSDKGYSQYYAVAGGKISLPCNVSFSSEEGSVSLILWYRGDTGVPIYTFDLRRGPLKEARHFPSSDLGARAYFDTSSKIPNLNINPVQVEDEGDYKCRIDYRRSRTVNYNVRLKVIVPPKEIIISDENGERLRDVIGPYDEGTFLTLICESTGGIPSPSVTWWRGSSLLDDSYFNTSDGAVRNELLLPRLHRFDLMAVITCQASNTNLTSASTASVKMDLNLRPLNVRITTSYRPVSYGKKLTLVCESSGSRPPAHLTWWIEYKKLQSGRNTVSGDNNITTSTLTFQPSISDNGKYVSCRAENPKLRNSAIEDRWTLNIYCK
ncbi:sialic acid-binding Ig-like lectin 14 [Centruroides sculpturatus]|uniref:sialic acid-binding Ig-like lectin 14 n=1 Tax=Centruroides sculpturatus TaxID=218467 RepID=UPI000C6EFA64|nr:sialic acid-binding Ig-like lectin 14 [Centruroides sculpturatus]